MNSDKIRKEVKNAKKKQERDVEISREVTEQFFNAETEMDKRPPFNMRVDIVRTIFMAGYEMGKKHAKEDAKE